MNLGATRSTREALIAELLGDLDKALQRVEALPATLEPAEARLSETAERLTRAAAQITAATITLNDAARRDLTALIALRTDEAAQAAAKQAVSAVLGYVRSDGMTAQFSTIIRREVRLAVRTMLGCTVIAALAGAATLWILTRLIP